MSEMQVFKRFLSVRSLSILTIIAFLLLTLGVAVSWNTPVTGYDISIYSSTPLIYWIALIFGIAVSFLLIITDICSQSLPRYLQVIKWILLAFCMISLTYLLTIRGYYGYNFNGDTGTHIGHINAALASGTLSVIYPNLNIHTMFLHNLSGLDVIYLTKVTPPLFILLFIVGIYLLAREIFPNNGMAVLSAFAACALPFGVVSNYTGSLPLACYLPYTPALLFFSVFCLYIVYRIVNTQSSNKAFLVLGILLFVSALFYHILACAVLMLFVAVLCGWIIIKRGLYRNVVPVVTSLLTIVGTTVIAWVFWTTLMQYLNIPVRSLYNALFEQETGTAFSAEMSDMAGTASRMDLIDVLDVLIKQFGSTGLVMLLIALALPIVYFGVRKRLEFLNVVPFYIMIVPILSIAGVSFISSMSFQPGRMVMFVTIVGILLSGVVLYTLLQYVVKGEKKLWRVVSVLMLIGILMPLFVLGLQMYYPGIEVRVGSLENTYAEVDVINLYFEKGNLDYSLIGKGGFVIYRYAHLLYGGMYVNNSNTLVPIQKQGLIDNIPNHFWYNQYDSVQRWLSGTNYIIISNKVRHIEEIYKYIGSSRPFVPDDYEHFAFDSGVNKIIENGVLIIYLGNGVANKG